MPVIPGMGMAAMCRADIPKEGARKVDIPKEGARKVDIRKEGMLRRAGDMRLCG